MQYNLGQKIKTKKAHACGGCEWEIVRLGADVKLKCQKCGHAIFVMPDKLNKIIKTPSVSVRDIGSRENNGNA